MLDAYNQKYKDLSIDQLLDLQDKLSIHSYYLGELCAEWKKQYNFSYYTRKIMYNKAKQGFMNGTRMTEKLSAAKADTYAMVEIEEVFESEIENESVGYRLDILLKQVNQVLKSINQRISWRKKEYENSRNQNQT